MPTLAVPQIVEQPADVRDNSLLRFLVAQTMAESKEEMKKEKDKDDLSQHFNMLRCGVVKSARLHRRLEKGFRTFSNPRLSGTRVQNPHREHVPRMSSPWTWWSFSRNAPCSLGLIMWTEERALPSCFVSRSGKQAQ